MTTMISPPPSVPTPLSNAYVQRDQFEWVNVNCGDVIRWNSDEGLYQWWSWDWAAWSWWGETTTHTWTWFQYRGQVKWKLADVIGLGLVGLVVFAICASSGLTGVGWLMFGWFLFWGAVMSWLHTKHPDTYDFVTTVILVSYVWRAVDHDRSR